MKINTNIVSNEEDGRAVGGLGFVTSDNIRIRIRSEVVAEDSSSRTRAIVVIEAAGMKLEVPLEAEEASTLGDLLQKAVEPD